MTIHSERLVFRTGIGIKERIVLESVFSVVFALAV